MQGAWFSLIALMLSFGCSKDGSVNVNSTFDYSIEQSRSCFCPYGGQTAKIYVSADTIADALWISDGTHLSPGQRAGYRTIKGLIDEIAHWNTSLFVVNISYDSLNGYPSFLSIYPKAVVTSDSIVGGIFDAGVAYRTGNYIRYN